MITIRLHRFGTKNKPTYRICVGDKRKDTRGDYIEALGNYNPVSNPKILVINEARVKYWISVGAQPSATIRNLLVSKGIIEGPKVTAFKQKKPVVAVADVTPKVV